MPQPISQRISQRISRVDTAWLRIDNDVDPMMIVGVWLLQPGITHAALCTRTHRFNDSYQPLLAFAVLAVAGGLLIEPVQDGLLGLFAKKATEVMTNVPGPAVPLKFCAATLRQTMPWVPASGDIGVGVSILSSGGGVQFGSITDKQLCPHPRQIIDRFEPEFEKLLLVTMMLPWAESV